MHEAAGESDDTVGCQASDGNIRNSCEKGQTGVVQLVKGNYAVMKVKTVEFEMFLSSNSFGVASFGLLAQMLF